MNTIIAILITIILAIIMLCLVVLNEYKDVIWEEIYKRLRRDKDE